MEFLKLSHNGIHGSTPTHPHFQTKSIYSFFTSPKLIQYSRSTMTYLLFVLNTVFSLRITVHLSHCVKTLLHQQRSSSSPYRSSKLKSTQLHNTELKPSFAHFLELQSKTQHTTQSPQQISVFMHIMCFHYQE